MVATDDFSHACAMEWSIPTMVDDGFQVKLESMQYDGEWIYETTTLKQDLKRCSDMEGSGVIQLQLQRDTKPSGESKSCVQLLSSGDRGTVTVRHFSTTDSAGAVVSEEASDEPLRAEHVVFAQQYSMDNLVGFLKAVEQPTVKLLLGQEQPLIVEVALTADDGLLTFVQGPHAVG